MSQIVPDWVHLPPEVATLSLWPSLHDAELQDAQSDLLGRTLVLKFFISHVVKFHQMPEQTLFLFEFREVKSVRAVSYIAWPGGFEVQHNIPREEQGRLLAEYQSKSRQQSCEWDALEEILHHEDIFIDILEAELAENEGCIGLRLAGCLDCDVYHELFIQAASLHVSDSNGDQYDFCGFLALGEAYWDAFRNTERTKYADTN